MGEPMHRPRPPPPPGASPPANGNGAATAGPPPASPPLTPAARRKSPLPNGTAATAEEQARLLPSSAQKVPPGSAQKPGGRGHDGGSGRSAARSLLYGAGTVVLLMVVGMAASELNLRVSKKEALVVPSARLSSASFLAQQQQQLVARQPGEVLVADAAEPAGGSSSTSLTEMLTSAAAAVAQQLGAEVSSYLAGSNDALDAQQGDGGGAAVPPPKWRLRCAVVNNLVFHIDVMAGWTYAFQSAGCDVTVYQNGRSLGIEDVMSAWHTGSFRKPEVFPAEAGDYHIVIMPTFRDQHAELVQYLLQLPRLRKQRYFLTQHNPDWLLNHPNVDILQQQMLVPLLDAAHAREAAEAAGGGGGGGQLAPAAAQVAEQPLRVALATLAPCVSNYTLHFLREMAFNLTEGQTYAERVGSFRIRAHDMGGDDGEAKDNSEQRRQWVAKVINMEVPWLSPLVPWQAAANPVIVPSSAPVPAPAPAARRRLQDDGKQQQQQQQAGQKKPGGKRRPAPAPPPPPGPPLGAEAIALLAKLDQHAQGNYPRHICIQGKLENSRRNYTAAFEALSHPAVLHHLQESGERLLLLGHRSKNETVQIPDAIADMVVVLESLPYQLYFDTLSRCRAIILAFATDDYYVKKSSSTIATAINVGVPLVAERRTLTAYDFLQPAACFVYDDAVSNNADTGGKKGRKGKQGGRRRLAGEWRSEGATRQLAAAGKPGGKQEGGKQQQPKQQQPKQQQQAAAAPAEPRPRSYSAAILAALRAESSLAAHEAVKSLKAEVMNHNMMVAARFMAQSAAQFSAEERSEDAAWWQGRRVQRMQQGGLTGFAPAQR